MKVEYTLVINRLGRPLSPTRRTDMIRKKLRRGLARPITWLHKGIRVVQFLERKYDDAVVTDRFGIAIDPGYRHIGWAIYKINNENAIVLFAGTFKIDTPNVSIRIRKRAIYRKFRRYRRRANAIRKYGHAKRRIPRWKNRRKPIGWLPPTGIYLILCHRNLVRMFKKWLPIQEACIEYNSFRASQTSNSMRGNKCKSIREYVLQRDGYRCQICGKTNVPLEVHHKIRRVEGGSNSASNLITLCRDCHRKIHSFNSSYILKRHRQKRDSTILNVCMDRICDEIGTEVNGRVYLTTGFDTDIFREEHELPKAHWLDTIAIICNCLEPEVCELKYDEPITLIKYRRHPHRSSVVRTKDREYYETITWRIVAKNRRRKYGQIFPSLQDYLKRNPSHPPLRAFPGEQIRRVDWTKEKVVFRNENPNFIGRGALIEYIDSNNRKRYGVAKVFAPRNRRITLETGKHISLTKFRRILKFGGILPVF